MARIVMNHDALPFVIAEIAQGFEGEFVQARLLVAAAAAAGADAAKLQLVYADELATRDYKYHALFTKLEMPDQRWRDLAELAKSRSIALYLDIFGLRSLHLAESIGAGAVKIHSTDMGNPGLLSAVAQSSIPRVILSAGGCSRQEIDRALTLLQAKELILLLGFQGYPTPVEANQIARLKEFSNYLTPNRALRLGFADHAPPESPLSTLLAAMAMGAGATVVEKHLTLSRNLQLEDHESALNPDEFMVFVKSLKECALGLGQSEAKPDFGMHASEEGYRKLTRKHVVAARDIARGATINSEDLGLKRTASNEYLDDVALVAGRRAAESIPVDKAIVPSMLERD
jgi:sialic acid synthase SpsE